MNYYFNTQIKKLEADRDYCVRALLAVRIVTRVPKSEILSSLREPEAAQARFMLYDLMSSYGFDYAEIGRIINKHASTIKSGLDRHKKLMLQDEDYATQYENVVNKIR